MFAALLILLILPYTDMSRVRGSQFKPIFKLIFSFFIMNFFILLWIGAKHPISPYVEIGQIATAFYFSWFLILVPFISLTENTFLDLALIKKN